MARNAFNESIAALVSIVAGFVAGWTNRSLGTELEFDESKCVGRGDNLCALESVAFLTPKQEYVE